MTRFVLTTKATDVLLQTVTYQPVYHWLVSHPLGYCLPIWYLSFSLASSKMHRLNFKKGLCSFERFWNKLSGYFKTWKASNYSIVKSEPNKTKLGVCWQIYKFKSHIGRPRAMLLAFWLSQGYHLTGLLIRTVLPVHMNYLYGQCLYGV